jgi:hypothetical protein
MQVTEAPIQEAMTLWQQEITAGNFAFEHGRFQQANQRYACGLDVLLSLQSHHLSYESPPTAWVVDQFVPALVVSFLNIVDCNLAQGNAELACDCLVQGHIQLQSFAANLALKQDNEYCVCHHVSQLMHQTYLFSQRYAHRPELIEKLNHAMQTAPMQGQSLH